MTQFTEEEKTIRRIERRFSKGVVQYGLIEEGDKILIGLSGGKDSLALVELLGKRVRIYKPRFSVVAVHVVMKNIPYQSDTAYLKAHCEAYGVPFVQYETAFDPATDTRKSPCFLCSWNRRKALFTVAKEHGCNKIALGHHMDDLLETLVNMVLGSPAICIYRSNGRSTARATSLAKVFVNNFNLPESTAIIDLAYGRCRDDNSHWQNVLKYCKDGCFQAMIDEYIHMLKETAGFQSDGNQYQIVHDMMMDSLKIHTATYIADTYPDFKKRINGADRKSDGCRIRSSYAVGFTKDAGDNSKVVMRKENIRNAFNSPMRPFVLATTSIGQEGLDFHNYCRVIMHWNLPSNPIDLEQREGRINRFKCLAIRQNVADKYGKADDITFKRDIWTEMFEAAKAEKQNDQSELVPFWCFGKNQSVKIERLVPMYPMSKDEVNYERLIKVLSLYRLTLGQARQEELLEYLFKEFKDTNGLKKLFIDLSPFSKGKEG